MPTPVALFDHVVAHLKERLSQVAQVRANPSLLEPVVVNYQGFDMTLNQLASITVEDARTLVVQPWDKGAVTAIEKAIYASDLGLTPQTQDKLIRVKLPELTAEIRERVVKKIKEVKEEARIGIRQDRDGELRKIQDREKNKEINEDMRFRLKEELDKKVKEYNEKIDTVTDARISEIQAG